MSQEFLELGKSITKTETPSLSSWDIDAPRPLPDRTNKSTTVLEATKAAISSPPEAEAVERPQNATLVRGSSENANRTSDALQAVEKLLQTQASAPATESSLWQTVKDNPGKTALVAGSAVAVVGLAKFGLSRLATARLPRVMICEESPFMGEAIKEVLVKSGYKADLFLGARSLKNFVGIGTDGTDVAVDLSRYRLGVLAGGLKGKYHGVEIAQRLSSEKNLTTIGLSTSDKMDEAFRLNGASITTNKATGFAALHQKVIDPVSAIKSPVKTQATLDQFGIALRENKMLRKPSEEALMDAMKKFGLGD